MESFTTRVRASLRIAAALTAAAAVLAVASATSAETGPSPSPSPIPQGCRLRSPQPEAPLKLNVVAVRGRSKAIAMEKEVFDCFDAKSTLTEIRDVETFLEFVQATKTSNHGARRSPTASVSVVAATCRKKLTDGRVACRTEPVALGVTRAPLTRCSTTRGTYPFPPVEQPSHPVEMASAAVAGNRVRTVKVEKEVFDCGGRIADLYLVTDRTESLRGQEAGRTATRFSGLVCLKDEGRARVTVCRLFAP